MSNIDLMNLATFVEIVFLSGMLKSQTKKVLKLTMIQQGRQSMECLIQIIKKNINEKLQRNS